MMKDVVAERTGEGSTGAVRGESLVNTERKREE